MSRYTEPNEGYVLTIESFREGIYKGDFKDYDGFGHPSNGTHYNRSIYLNPSGAHLWPDDITHVVWINR